MSEARLKVPPSEQDHRQGSLRAPVILVEYGDFECPYCAAAVPIFEKLKDEFDMDLCFIYRHFPLRNIHPHAEMAAIAAEAADQQSHFWQMHLLLYENQELLSPENILILAETLGLDLKRFEEDTQRKDLRERVRHDFSGGLRSGVNGTPTVFLNGVRVDTPISYPFLRETVENSLRFAS